MAEFDSAIPPGGQGQVTASIDSTRFKNKVSKTVTLTSNDPDNPRLALRLSAEILVAVDVQPNDRVFVRGKLGEIAPQALSIVSNTGQVFDITEVQKRSDEIKVSFVPAPELAKEPTGQPKPKLNKAAVASGASAYRMTIEFGDGLRPGRLSDRLRLVTTHEEMSNIDITVSGQVQGNVVVQPERLFFFNNRNGTNETRKEVTISKRPTGGLEIKRITSTDATFQTQVIPVSPGLEYKIEVTRSPGSEGSQASGRLVIETNDPQQPRLEVTVTAR